MSQYLQCLLSKQSELTRLSEECATLRARDSNLSAFTQRLSEQAASLQTTQMMLSTQLDEAQNDADSARQAARQAEEALVAAQAARRQSDEQITDLNNRVGHI
ncbi:unnamed protein product [Protopolystoma xenopodis]|uniref:Uncharacterized protein n=1 Tax=Protopolystoma xenopodis TaxID=117903 RepID=A0A448XLS2_9PLAT|nr:unnamed protein product [Protopolystoma xenopodis]